MARSSTAKKPEPRTVATKLAQQRLSVLELGNVAEACRQRDMDRTSFYEWKRRFQTQGFDGLRDLPPIHKSHPQTTSPDTIPRQVHIPFDGRSGANHCVAGIRIPHVEERWRTIVGISVA